MDADEVNVRFRAVFADPLDAGILVHEAGGNDTGGDRHHAHAQKGDQNAEDLAKGGNGVNVSVTHRQQGGYRPPDAGKGVGEHLGLRVMLQRVHAQTGSGHQHQNDEYGGQKLLGFTGEDLGNDIQRIVIGVDPEQPEDPHHPEHPEGHGPGGEEKGHIVGQKAQQVHDA